MKLYSLGSGCFPVSHSNLYEPVKKCMAPHQCFSAVLWSPSSEKFLPYYLFDGTLKKVFLNFEFDFIKLKLNWEPVRKMAGGYDWTFKNNETGFNFTHIQLRKDLSYYFTTEKIQERFGYFEENKYNLFYTMDFSRLGYEKATNKQLLEFESYLLKNNFDLNNFLYLDIESYNKDKFKDTRIRKITCPDNEVYCMHVPSNPYNKCASCYFYRNFDKFIKEYNLPIS